MLLEKLGVVLDFRLILWVRCVVTFLLRFVSLALGLALLGLLGGFALGCLSHAIDFWLGSALLILRLPGYLLVSASPTSLRVDVVAFCIYV